MAAIAFHGSNKVPRILTDGGCAVVARRAGTEYLGVVYVKHWRPDSWCMTVFADVGRKSMLWVFAGCYRAVVTAEAIASDIGVIEIRGQPRDGSVAVVAGVAARNMGRRFASSNIAVVAGLTGPNDMGVVHHGRRCPEVHTMAVFAYSGGLYVRDVLARRIGAVMAAGTVSRDGRVVEVRWRPPDGRVAIVTVVATGEVGRMLAGGGIAVMTGTAAAEYLCVINSYYWQPTNRVMAILADISGLYVGWILAGRVSAVVAARAIASDVDMIEVGGYPA